MLAPARTHWFRPTVSGRTNGEGARRQSRAPVLPGYQLTPTAPGRMLNLASDVSADAAKPMSSNAYSPRQLICMHMYTRSPAYTRRLCAAQSHLVNNCTHHDVHRGRMSPSLAPLTAIMSADIGVGSRVAGVPCPFSMAWVRMACQHWDCCIRMLDKYCMTYCNIGRCLI